MDENLHPFVIEKYESLSIRAFYKEREGIGFSNSRKSFTAEIQSS